MLYMCTTGETVHPDKPDVMVATSQLHDLHNLRVPNKKSVDPDPFTLTVSQCVVPPSLSWSMPGEVTSAAASNL